MHILIGLVLVFVVMAILGNRKMRHCRWRMDRTRNQDGRTFYTCAACGAVEYTPDGKPPRLCLKA